MLYLYIMYKLKRIGDNKVIEDMRFYANLEHQDDIHQKNIVTKFPPKVGSSVMIYNGFFDLWQTTVVEKIIKKHSETKYTFSTKNSVYIVEEY